MAASIHEEIRLTDRCSNTEEISSVDALDVPGEFALIRLSGMFTSKRTCKVEPYDFSNFGVM
jgi:hypothetical protein